MTGRGTHIVDRDAVAHEAELLLTTGPFAPALRAAIRARGLGLERIRYRLRSRGVSISLATLSHWQSGRCRPERQESLRVLRHLEVVLEVPSRSLTQLLEIPSTHARCDVRGEPFARARGRDRDT
ncbi:MAG: hypothetical protein JWQ81_605 [Amycolatopsis sp.]|jgi:hypothetical protein|uniref:transcriptional regulator n=1 Tax=Amycolatopsis sp. TaxID=37632 RepID=UPI00261EB9DF|nr:transcriptional regulator [Amycolatopsis sp.]MCU1679866.1 hypothetical protein [Amycolatopsis sp.]